MGVFQGRLRGRDFSHCNCDKLPPRVRLFSEDSSFIRVQWFSWLGGMVGGIKWLLMSHGERKRKEKERKKDTAHRKVCQNPNRAESGDPAPQRLPPRETHDNIRYLKTRRPTHKFDYKMVGPFYVFNIIFPTAYGLISRKNGVSITPFIYFSWNLTAPVYRKLLIRIKSYRIRNRLKLKIMKSIRLRIPYTLKGILLNT